MQIDTMIIPILFENEHCVVIDKPPGWLSVPGRTADDARLIVGRVLEKQLGISILPVHRLDADVSGALLYAKTKEFHRDINMAFEKHAVRKTYQALTELSSFEAGSTREWRSKLVRGKKRSFEADHGKISITEAQVLQRTRTHLDWRLNPVTGRPHQLRFELAKHQCPILGDSLYGSQQKWPLGGIALRSIKIEIPEDLQQKWQIPSAFTAQPFEEKISDTP